MQNSKTIAVIGATGKTGSRVAARLESQGRKVRRASRRAAPSFDWSRPDGWDAVLSGVTSAYLTYVPDLAEPAAPARIERFREAALRCGVEHLVLLSGRGEEGARRSEEILLGSSIPTTVVRCSWFFQNFSEGPLRSAVHEGVIGMPAGDVREPFIDADDIADVVAVALMDPEPRSRVLELTGPELLTFSEVARILSRELDREIAYYPLTFEQFLEQLTPLVGVDSARLLTNLCREVFDGRNESVTDTVSSVLGRPARTFSSYVQRTSREGVWLPHRAEKESV